MDNYLLAVIKQTTGYIEARLLEELNLDRISENINISKFHLLRIWKGATSTGIMEYVRRRRLALSLGDLLNTQHTVEFIADRCLFGSERAYSRAFKEEFGVTPAKWRRDPVRLDILDRFNADFINLAGEGIIFYRSVSVVPALKLAGFEYRISRGIYDSDFDPGIIGSGFFRNESPGIINPVNGNVYYGLTENLSGSEAVYMPSVRIGEDSVIPEGMIIKCLASYKYGVFTYMGSHSPEELSAERLTGLRDFIERKWIPTISQRTGINFSFEYIDYSKCSRQYCQCDLYYPISGL